MTSSPRRLSPPSSSTSLRHPPPPCTHLAAYRALSNPFRGLHLRLRHIPPFGRTELRLPSSPPTRCAACSSPSPRLLACLACSSLSCVPHAADHAAPGHEIAVDVHRAELFCCVCRDQVYDADFDAAVVLARTTSSPPAQNLRKRRRIERNSTTPELDLRLGDVRPRGMNNLGSTCFMNSVLQALMHVELLRNYFLSDRHDRHGCRERRRKGAGSCLACELDAVYLAVFEGDRTPYSPARFLYSWWQHASNLASYEQQDAHEFFISMLDGIHEKLEEDEKKSHIKGAVWSKLFGNGIKYCGRSTPRWFVNQSNELHDTSLNRRDSGDCCIAHRVFSGILRSDVICIRCGFTSTTYDPCVDISLDLDSSHTVKSVVPSKLEACNDEMEFYSQSCPSLMGCLQRFTRLERLGSDPKFFCQRCQERQESLKQMSITKLPLVICFHIKRFEHSSLRQTSRKVDSYLQFPFSLDMSPYLSSSILRERFGNRISASETDDSDASTPLLSTKFELFAVITHSGRLEAGHYTTYLRPDDQWYKCDDAWISHVNENIVRATQAYMLFYVQKTCYQANENMVAL